MYIYIYHKFGSVRTEHRVCWGGPGICHSSALVLHYITLHYIILLYHMISYHIGFDRYELRVCQRRSALLVLCLACRKRPGALCLRRG